jgi:hypothetical protein
MKLDQLEMEVFRAVRQELTPSDEAAERVRGAVLARIALTAPPVPHHPGAVAGAAKAQLASTALGKTAWTIALLTTGFGLGWGSHSVVAERPRVLQSVPSVPGSTGVPPAAVVSGSAPPPGAASVQPGPEARFTPLGTPPTRAETEAPAKSASSRASTAEQQLIEEVRLLRQADRALRAGDPRTALESLEQLKLAVPEGKLGEEREAVQRLADCLGHPGVIARELAVTFLKAHPSTVYSGRIRETCGLAAKSDGEE